MNETENDDGTKPETLDIPDWIKQSFQHALIPPEVSPHPENSIHRLPVRTVRLLDVE